MATTNHRPTRTSLRFPRAIELTKSVASKPGGPQTPNLPFARADPPSIRSLLALKAAAANSTNLHSLNSRPTVSCNEGFPNAPRACPFRKSYPRVPMMKTRQNGYGDNGPVSLDGPM